MTSNVSITAIQVVLYLFDFEFPQVVMKPLSPVGSFSFARTREMERRSILAGIERPI